MWKWYPLRVEFYSNEKSASVRIYCHISSSTLPGISRFMRDMIFDEILSNRRKLFKDNKAVTKVLMPIIIADEPPDSLPLSGVLLNIYDKYWILVPQVFRVNLNKGKYFFYENGVKVSHVEFCEDCKKELDCYCGIGKGPWNCFTKNTRYFKIKPTEFIDKMPRYRKADIKEFIHDLERKIRRAHSVEISSNNYQYTEGKWNAMFTLELKLPHIKVGDK